MPPMPLSSPPSRRHSREAGGAASNNQVSDTLPTAAAHAADFRAFRSEEHTSELQSLMRNSYAVFCLKKKIHILYSTTKKIAKSQPLKYSTPHITPRLHNQTLNNHNN